MESIRKQISGKPSSEKSDVFRESEVLSILVKYLKENGWKVKEQIRVEGGRIDVGAEKEGRILLIEAKGEDRGVNGSAEMNFQMGLGQVMSRMKHKAEYGLAFPSTKNFNSVTKISRQFRIRETWNLSCSSKKRRIVPINFTDCFLEISR